MKSAKYIVRGFASIGLFIGLIAGFSIAELTTTLLALIFALAGGSVIALLGKLDEDARALAGMALTAFGFVGSVAFVGAMILRINGILALSIEPDAVAAARTPLRSSETTINGECLRRISSGALDIVDFCQVSPLPATTPLGD